MASKGDYKSSLHYLVLLPSHSGISFDEFLLYFTNKYIGKLDFALSETNLRFEFHKKLGSFYSHNEITNLDEFRFIVTRSVSISICKAPDISIGTHLSLCVNIF